MPRISRAIVVGYPHHITQRGNYRQAIFAEKHDYDQYLAWLVQYAAKYDTEIWAYCLMPNHVHFVGVPLRPDSLSRTLNTVHMQYAQYFNRKKNTNGHLWQGRFFSCVLDERHLYAAVRYVEMNPVRGGIAAKPEEYLWSSARGRIAGTPDPVLSGRCFLTETVTDWRQYLVEEADAAGQAEVIKSTRNGHPCGNEYFVKQMEGLLRRRFAPRPSGRPRNSRNVEERVQKTKTRDSAPIF